MLSVFIIIIKCILITMLGSVLFPRHFHALYIRKLQLRKIYDKYDTIDNNNRVNRYANYIKYEINNNNDRYDNKDNNSRNNINYKYVIFGIYIIFDRFISFCQFQFSPLKFLVSRPNQGY